MSTLSQDLNLLETRGLVRVTPEREKPIARFKHALTREATYNTILQSRRAELHRAAAQTLAALHPQPDLEMVLTIAEHWQRGNEDGFALETIVPHAQTLIYTGRSISLTGLLSRLERENLNEVQQCDLDIALADVCAAQGEYAAARNLYENALQHPTADARRARLLHSLGVAAYHLNDNTRAIEYQLESFHLAERAHDRKQQAQASGGLGLVYWNLGDFGRAEEHLQLSRSLALQIGESIELANAEFNVAGMLLDRGDDQTAIAYAQRALMLYENLGHTAQAARTLQLLGACYYSSHDLAGAAAQYQHAIQKSRELGDSLYVALALGNLAEVYFDWNQIDQAADAYTTAISLLRALKYDSLLAYDLASLASVQIRQAIAPPAPNTAVDDSLKQAQANLNEALEIANRIHSLEDEGLARRVMAELDAALGNWDTARQNAQQAVGLLQPLGRALELERAQRTQQRILAASGSDQTRV